MWLQSTQSQVTSTAQCVRCEHCCGFLCSSYDNSSGCRISTGPALLTHPRVMPVSMCFHELNECVSCPHEEHSWRDSRPSPDLKLYVSGNCHQPQWGRVHWNESIKLRGTLLGPATIVGSCPLVSLHAGAVIRDIEFECAGGADVAIEVVSGAGASLENVSVLHASVFRAASPDGVDLDGFTASVSSNHRAIAAIGNGKGDFSVECNSFGTVAVQRLEDSKASYGGKCDTIDVGDLLGAFGTLYETKFYNKNAEEDLEGDLLDSMFLWSWRIALTLLLVFGLIHEDYSAVRDITQQYIE